MNTYFFHPLPTLEIATNPTNVGSQEYRIRRALGIENGPLPEVQTEWLHRYYDYLRTRLVLPFDAQYAQDLIGYQSQVSSIVVTSLIDPGYHDRHEEAGLLCRAWRGTEEVEVPLADVELAENSTNSQLIEDYWYWFWNWRFDPRI